MDIRTSILQSVVGALSGKVEDGIIDLVHDVLVIQLNNYELMERCTEVAVRDDTAEGMLNKYIATKRIEGKAETTLQRYREQDIALLRYLGKPLDRIATDDIRFYLSVKRQRDGVSNRTLEGMRRCYNSFFGWLATERYIQYNPCAALAPIKYRKVAKKPYSGAEMKRIEEACESVRNLALVDFLYASGCRVSEVARLDISDIDFGAMSCTVLGKGNKERTVYLTDVAVMHLQKYLDGRRDSSGALFVGRGGERLGKNGIEAIVKRIGKRAGVDNVHPHRFRRTLATNLMNHGMPIQHVAAILGHADLKTTQVYCAIDQQHVESDYRKFAA